MRCMAILQPAVNPEYGIRRQHIPHFREGRRRQPSSEKRLDFPHSRCPPAGARVCRGAKGSAFALRYVIASSVPAPWKACLQPRAMLCSFAVAAINVFPDYAVASARICT